MKKNKIRSVLCILCASVLLFTAVFPVSAFAAEEEQLQTLTAAEVQQMQQADAAVTALTASGTFAGMTLEQRQAAAMETLEELAEQGLILRSSIYVDESSMVSFMYSCGVLGGILLEDAEEITFGAQELEQTLTEALASVQSEAENTKSGKRAAIYYAFDDTVESTRYPHYVYMQAYWTALGLDTDLKTEVTVSGLRKMGNYDLCVLSAHGAYYTYEYGWLWKRQATEPVILLTEESDFWTDVKYGFDLLNHRVIKVNGMYAVTADFFRSAYRFNQLDGTIILSETCEFFGRKKHEDLAFADAFLAGGASAVVGYINNVYAMYSRNMLWTMTNCLIQGCTVEEAMDMATQIYGTDDLIWYHSQGGKRPHALASYPILCGQPHARLTEPAEQAAAA